MSFSEPSRKKGLYVCVRRRTLCTLVPYSPPLLLSQKKHIPQGTGIMHVEFRMTAVWKNDLFERGSRRQCVDCQPINRGVIMRNSASRKRLSVRGGHWHWGSASLRFRKGLARPMALAQIYAIAEISPKAPCKPILTLHPYSSVNTIQTTGTLDPRSTTATPLCVPACVNSRSTRKVSTTTQPLTRMLPHPLTFMFALAMPVQATPILLGKKLHQRDVTTDTHTGDHQLSTEAIISVVGVVVAVLGIASTLVWSKRRKSCSRSRRTSEGIHMSKFLYFEKIDLICSTRIDTLQPSDVWQCFYAVIPSQYLGAHS